MFNKVFLLLVSVVFISEAFKVKINNENIIDVDKRVDGDNYKHMGVISLDFLPHTNWKEPILKVENFNHVQRINLDNNALVVIPAFEDLPDLKELSLNQNMITNIFTSNFAFIQVLKLSMAYNRIKSIYNSSFNKELIHLNLQCNLLNEVSSSWFPNPDKLEVLDVSYNAITKIKVKLFRKFTNLNYLNLSGNKIKTIEPYSFTFERLNMLDLSMNAITELQPNIFFKETVEINSINITYNKLNYLNELFLKKIFEDTPGEKEISTFGNPWQCFCLRNVENLLHRNNIIQNEPLESLTEAKCVFSLTYQQTCAETVDPELYETYSKYVKRNKTACDK